MAILFYKTKEQYGCFSNFSRHSIWLDGQSWPTTEHYFQAQKYVGNPQYMKILEAATPRIAAELGRDRSIPIRKDWEEVKDGIMKKCVLRKFQCHDDIRKILVDTGDELLVENSPIDAYWGIGPKGDGKNMLGKILVEVRDYLKIYHQCRTCGTAHKIKEHCPPGAFRLLTCSCGNETLMPCDALCMGIKGMMCGQCGLDTGWKPKVPTVEDIKRHWEDYIPPSE